uniref:Replication factor A C-terminal domain-containing protein n=1 Tax=Anolis carolinensis TaxID=28377 RepID=A0A803SPN2_ANOCA|nr:PREDICTED: DNA damage-induced apoptosis suppressor protein [Anolis carolinensis]|eukprot:XP_016848189.1 PREDICTED: DNA damage-induced apoptosis suppressor protein [Anolis carolinensis]
MNGRRLLVASVISIQNSHFVYPSCQNCFSKLFLNLKRYSCLKCGCSGDSKEANYRYRLSLEVADTQSVFEVTVFGSCLDVYFGVTAKDLQRYIETLRQEIGEADGDATPDVLFRAVENCFIGKKFIFGIKDYGKPESTISWENDSRTDRYCKALTACQMFMPNSTLIGNTVIHYLHQRQCSHFKQGLGGVCPPDLFAAFDQPSSLLSCLPSSNDLDVAPSCCADGLSALWPQSFRLTSSPASSGTAADPVDFNPSQTAYPRQKWEDNPVSLYSQSVHNSQDHHLTVTKRDVQEDKRHHLCRSQRNSINTKSQSESDSFLGREGGRSLQSPLELKRKISSSKNCTQRNYWLKKSSKPLPCQRQDASLSFPASSSFHLPSREDADSQEDPGLWDELPSSESLDEFIAKLECDKTVLSPIHFPHDGADEFHGHFNQLSSQRNIYHVNLKTEQPGENSQVLTEKIKNNKSGLPCHKVNLSPFHNSQGSHQQAFHSSLSCKGREESGHLPHQPLVLPPSYFLTEVKSRTEESCLKSEIEQEVSSSKNRLSRSCSKISSKCFKKSSLLIRDITYLNDHEHGNLFKWKETESPCNENQTPNITNIQEDSFTLVTCKKTIGNDRTNDKLLFQDNRCSFKADVGNMLQNCSNVHEASYNASADLFDSTQEPEATVGKLNSTHIFLAQENLVTKECTTSKFTSEHSFPGSLHELNDSWNASLCSLPDPKTNSPAAALPYGPEHSLVGSLDFIPNSQSTPLARPCLQGRVLKGKESVLGKLPLSWVGAKCKRPRPALGNPSLKHLVSRFLQCTKASDATEGQQLFIQSSPVQDLPENNDEEWIPPSEKKQIQPFGIQNEKVLRKNLMRNSADCQVIENSPRSERCGIPMSSIRLLRRELSFKKQAGIKSKRQPMGKDEADGREVMNGSPGFPVFSDVRSNLSSTPRSTANVSSWSPELFSNSVQLLNTDIVSPKLSS